MHHGICQIKFFIDVRKCAATSRPRRDAKRRSRTLSMKKKEAVSQKEVLCLWGVRTMRLRHGDRPRPVNAVITLERSRVRKVLLELAPVERIALAQRLRLSRETGSVKQECNSDHGRTGQVCERGCKMEMFGAAQAQSTIARQSLTRLVGEEEAVEGRYARSASISSRSSSTHSMPSSSA